MTVKRNPADNLLKGISANPEVAARQKAALVPGGHRSHGAYGGQRLAELRVEHDAALAVDYPSLDVRRRVLLADRLARCQLVMAWCDENGITPSGKARHGQAFAIVGHLDKWSAQADALLAQAVAVERERKDDPGAALAAIHAEYAARDNQADDATVIDDGDDQPMRVRPFSCRRGWCCDRAALPVFGWVACVGFRNCGLGWCRVLVLWVFWRWCFGGFWIFTRVTGFLKWGVL